MLAGLRADWSPIELHIPGGRPQPCALGLLLNEVRSGRSKVNNRCLPGLGFYGITKRYSPVNRRAVALIFARLLRRSAYALLLAAFCLIVLQSARASLESYDTVISTDAAGGLTPASRLTAALTFTGANRAAFDFGVITNDATFEFILEGDIGPSTSAYLAVGTNSTSNLRYELYYDTGQLGFTQLGVADYQFSPGVPSPAQPTHIAYVWSAANRTMKLYTNGVLAGTRSGVDAGFGMPQGQGWLGANTSNGENMTGTIYRLTAYNGIVSEEVIKAHSDAFNGIVPPPIIVSFGANPSTLFTPSSSTLSWEVRKAVAVFLNGSDVTVISNLVVSPIATTTYTLTATNTGGAVSSQVTVLVNPPPLINSFKASSSYIGAGQSVTLSWNVSYGQSFSIAPGVGDVTGRTVGGVGTITLQPASSTTYVLTATSTFGTAAAQTAIQIVQPANHLVISEFMADDQTTLADEDGEHSGWIEIHNPTANSVNLAGHFLTDDAVNPRKWDFPPTNLESGAYMVVFASGKDRTNAAAPFHTNFRLKNSGEYLALVGPGPVLLHAYAPAYPPQRPDISYGILGDDLNLQCYMDVPTPGMPNDDTPPPPLSPLFSVPGGMFTQPFTVTLSAPDSGAQIRFTTNGTAPSATNGILYTGPVLVTNTVHFRSIAILDGRVSKISGTSYLKLAPELAGYTSSLPIMVIDNFGAGVIPQKGWSASGAGIIQVPRQTATWATFERSGGISAFTNPPQMFSLIGIRGRGAYSTTWRQKPYSVAAVDENGSEAKVSPLSMPAHAQWVLYFPDSDQDKDPTLLFNTFVYELSRTLGDYAVRFRWVEAFINEDGGELRLSDRRGVYAIIERVARGKDRLDFQKLSADGTTGGWLLDINRMDPQPETGWPAPNGALCPWFFHTAGPNRIVETTPNTSYGTVPGDDLPQQWNAYINFDNPNGYAINTAQRAAIEAWFKQFEDALYNDNVWRDPVNGYRRFIVELDFIDYFVIHVLTRNGDGLLLSMYPWKGDDGKVRMGPCWDYNWSSYNISGGPTGSLMHRSEQLWYRRLFADPDFLQAYIDRWCQLRAGPLSNAAMDAIVDRQCADITPEKSLLNGMPSVSEWTNRLGQMKTWLKQRANWIDSNYLFPPIFNPNGGAVPDGVLVTLTGTNGIVYFTTDGSDPRASGGTVAPTAQVYQAPFALRAPTLVQARVKNGTVWSGLASAFFRTPQDLTPLAVTEIMYNPPPYSIWKGNDLEFIELKNTGTNTLNLGGLGFTAGITFNFSTGTLLGPGQFFVLVKNTAAFQARYPGVTVNGVFTGQLDNAGEKLRLATESGGAIFEFAYGNRAPWPLAADGYGFSVVPQNAPDNSGNGSHWRASSAPGGSPGADDPAPTTVGVVINEILSHTDWPQVDTVELFNPTTQDADISGWYLSDDGTVPKKFRIPDNTVLHAGGYRLFTEADFNPAPGTLLNFALDSHGDSIYLTAADLAGNFTGYGHGVDFGAAANGVSFGRYINSVGEVQFPAQIETTLGGPNAGPRVGPVVITEIMYHPPAGGAEYVELRNITGADIPLFDPVNPTNTWHLSGLGFAFPTNIVLPANGLLIITTTNPPDFHAIYSVPTNVVVLGPAPGVLQDDGERLQLRRSDSPDTNGVPYITVDEIRYEGAAPWPAEANGGGFSLQRKVPFAYGNDPVNWIAATPTPGVDFSLLDSDGDGMLNWQEYAAGTDPNDPLSYLRIESITASNIATLTFQAVSNKTYTVEFSDQLENGTWSKLTDVLAQPVTRMETVADPAARTNRLYRLVTPRQP